MFRIEPNASCCIGGGGSGDNCTVAAAAGGAGENCTEVATAGTGTSLLSGVRR